MSMVSVTLAVRPSTRSALVGTARPAESFFTRGRVAARAAADTARVAGKKAGQMVDVAKLNVQLFDLNGDFNDILRRLGQVMYDTHRGQTPEGDPVTELLAEADETAAKVEEVKSRIADLRQKIEERPDWEKAVEELDGEVSRIRENLRMAVLRANDSVNSALNKMTANAREDLSKLSSVLGTGRQELCGLQNRRSVY